MITKQQIRNIMRTHSPTTFDEISFILYGKFMDQHLKEYDATKDIVKLNEIFFDVFETLYDMNNIRFNAKKWKSHNIFDVEVLKNNQVVSEYREGSEWRQQVMIRSINLIGITWSLNEETVTRSNLRVKRRNMLNQVLG